MSNRQASRALAILGVVLYGCANPVTEDTGDVEAAVVAQPLVEGECTDAEIQSLLGTFSVANGAIDQASATTPVSDPVRWRTWFSSGVSDDQVNHVKSTLGGIATNVFENELRCEKHDGGTGGPGFAPCHNVNKRAYVRQGEPIIHFCPSFFDLGPMWKLNAIVHESAHLVLGDTDFTPNGSAAEAEALAHRDLDTAFRNASNFAHFVTNDPSIDANTDL